MESGETKKSNELVAVAVVAFHDHLDVCKQCANNPFSLCSKGQKLLHEAALALKVPLI